MRVMRVRVALAAAALLIVIVSPVPVYAATPTTTELAVQPAEPQALQEVCVLVSTTVTEGGGSVDGSLTLWDTTTGSDVFVTTFPYGGGNSSSSVCYSNGLSIGTHTYRGDYSGTASYDASSDTLEFNVAKVAPVFYLSTIPESPDAGSPYEITAGFTNPNFQEEGSFEIHQVGVVDPICSGAPTTESWISCTVTAPSTPGTYRLTVGNSGSASVAAATSDPFDLVVQPNSVHASGLGVQYSTFYPVKDGYRDTVAITGTRVEPIAVTIKIYSPGGSLIKTQTIASGTGAYSYKWNGRTSDGTVRPEGKYKVTQRLQDGIGASETSTFFVTLFRKKLIWHSTSITKNGAAFDAKGTAGQGRVTRSSSGYVRIKAPDPFFDWAGAGWQFSLRSGLRYKDVVVRVYAKHSFIFGDADLGAQDFSDCALSPSWNDGCFDTRKNLAGPVGATVWTSTAELSASHVSGRTVRSLVRVYGSDVYVYKARVSYRYATLGY